MLERLEQIEARYEELANELSAPELLADQKAYTKAARQHRTLGEIVEKYRAFKTLQSELSGAQELVDGADDDEMRELARGEDEARIRRASRAARAPDGSEWQNSHLRDYRCRVAGSGRS